MYICICKGITDKTIREAVATGKSFSALKRELGLSAQCGVCVADAISLIKKEQLQYQGQAYAANVRAAHDQSIAIKQVA
ncbi:MULTISPECIES: (2Fe-2S)-binding protein [Motilimonas]|uniref:Bacterioferritin-associated ferredoxin n=1 Tax=Motilimonas cestriensis TaxID=2742685 RepID=A0ABS8WEE9_9GAMM|nr:(2Fe-2S)-binding protein [Motilimonas sp. 1_MG-2023]MCE0555836.1 (2Fe-2S)-binding protein [Motilimonas sp. E26]MCE2596006.1 (2Fe-2S)-binding protein [Motilimonas cestriensis]MDO6524115.1 (2Fe-2S)-binding protein [Motilimonas sp. 1_MG-2023]